MTPSDHLTIGIDPGYGKGSGGCALAVLRNNLFAQSYLGPPYYPGTGPSLPSGCIVSVALELPQGDDRTWSVPPEVIARLASDGALLAGLVLAEGLRRGDSPVYQPLYPRQWKGSQHKPQQHLAMWRTLTPEECQVLGGNGTLDEIIKACARGALERWKRPGVEYYSPGFTMHNVLDALCIAKFARSNPNVSAFRTPASSSRATASRSSTTNTPKRSRIRAR